MRRTPPAKPEAVAFLTRFAGTSGGRKTIARTVSRFQNLVAAEVTRLKHSEEQSLLTSAAKVLKEPLSWSSFHVFTN